MERETTLACSAGLAAEYHDYIVRTAQKIRELKPSSKLWWKSHETRGPGNDGVWVLDAQGKANLFADTFSGKCQLPQPRLNVYTECHNAHPLFSRQKNNVGTLSRTSVRKAPLVRTWCLHASSKDVRSSWPNCCRSCQLETASWPESLREHWIVPIYKKKAVFFSRQQQRCPLDCTIVKGWRTLGAPNARNTHQPHSCFRTKSVPQHERPRSKGRVGLFRDVLDSCAQPTQESCCLLFGCLRGFRQGTGRETSGKTPMQRSSPGLGQSGGVLAAATNRSGGRGRPTIGQDFLQKHGVPGHRAWTPHSGTCSTRMPGALSRRRGSWKSSMLTT